MFDCSKTCADLCRSRSRTSTRVRKGTLLPVFDRPKLNQYSALSELASVAHFLLMCVCVCLLLVVSLHLLITVSLETGFVTSWMLTKLT